MRSTDRDGWRVRREELPVSELLYVLWGRRGLVLCAVGLLVLAVLLFSLLRGPDYAAEAVVGITPQQQAAGGGEQEVFAEEVLGAVATRELLQQAARRAGWGDRVEEFRRRLDPEPSVTQDGRAVLRVRFRGDTPREAASGANAYAGLFVERVNELGKDRLAGGSLAAGAELLSAAAPGEAYLSYHPVLYLLLAVVVGVVLGGAAALLLDTRGNRWRDARDAEMTLRAPVLGVIPDHSALEREE
ncbi:lipopolysaccharide biosynthesis [Rubrobacter xylanophilus DSM 9941]|uniref:Lipopolysaccharide biosynthesis n=1 Tax=Rubrobacter xylanophilus (strain DSM 9941 / JCM 11954 / NBRC 16129 / PRD-1) TaxID=266117 RepID=Q1ASL5_RUBXD|nr:hypothetical protein [Rubrobacter xylanophilus]ABG05613.1 lipopolysaccharide biosynthesis [Rubrobacter xylanophilus DSM 9941]